MPHSEHQPEINFHARRGRWIHEIDGVVEYDDPSAELAELCEDVAQEEAMYGNAKFHDDIRVELVIAFLKQDDVDGALRTQRDLSTPRALMKSFEKLAEFDLISPQRAVKGGVQLALEQEDPDAALEVWERLILFAPNHVDPHKYAEIELLHQRTRNRVRERNAAGRASSPAYASRHLA